jgi:hypothetical protein
MPATAAQIGYLSSLALTHAVPPRIYEVLAGAPSGRSTYGAVSEAINVAKAAPYAQEKKVEAEKGYYLLDGVVHAVVSGRESGNLYAKKLIIESGWDGVKRARWEYSRGGIFRCVPAARLTLAEAKALGHLHGFCMICGKPLTDVKSVEAGIGPVCLKKL